MRKFLKSIYTCDCKIKVSLQKYNSQLSWVPIKTRCVCNRRGMRGVEELVKRRFGVKDTLFFFNARMLKYDCFQCELK